MRSLSPLEGDVLRVLWACGHMRVREIHNILKKEQQVALTSIAVMLDRLHQKGLVEREAEPARGGLRYIYFTVQRREDVERRMVERAVDKIIERYGEAAVSYFMERFR